MHLLADLFYVLLGGFLVGELADRLRLPRLIGMIGAGVLLGPHLLDLFSSSLYAISAEVRMLALLVILMKAGLGLDKKKILAQGSVAIRLGFLPAVIEATVVAVATRWMFGWEWLYCWLLAWIICAASPAVIVPMMLHLKAKGWGVDKGIPDLILAGGTMSDATAVTMFGIFLAWASEGGQSGVLQQLGSIPVQVTGGVLLGYLAGKLGRWLLCQISLTTGVMQDLVVAGSLGLLLILGGSLLPYSDFLAVMVMGFVILETDPVLARRLRVELDKVWVVAQILLFGLIGAAVNLDVVASAGLRGLAIIGLGLAVGRWLGIFASTWRSIITLRERVFMVVGDMAKATVQAAIGGIPLAMGLPYGEEILAIAVLSILITAPLGALGTVTLAPRMLARGKVDPTRVTVSKDHCFLVAVDGLAASRAALEKAGAMARECDARIVVLHVAAGEVDPELQKDLELIRDISHEFTVRHGSEAEIIAEIAGDVSADYIFLGKANRSHPEGTSPGSVSRQVIEATDIPVILVDEHEGADAFREAPA